MRLSGLERDLWRPQLEPDAAVLIPALQEYISTPGLNTRLPTFAEVQIEHILFRVESLRKKTYALLRLKRQACFEILTPPCNMEAHHAYAGDCGAPVGGYPMLSRETNRLI